MRSFHSIGGSWMSRGAGTKGDGPPWQALALTDSKALVEGLKNAGVGVWRWSIDEDRLAWTENLPELHNLSVKDFDGTIGSFSRDIHEDDAPRVWQAIDQAIAKGGSFKVVYRSASATSDAPLWFEARGGFVTEENGMRVLTGVCSDATDRVVARQELERRLKQQKAIASLGSFALETREFSAVLDQAVLSAAQVLDAPLTKILRLADTADHLVVTAGVGWPPGVVGMATVPVDQLSQAGYTLSAPGPVIVADLASETRFTGSPLLKDQGVVSGISVVIAGSDARPFGVFTVHTRARRAFDEADAGFMLALSNIVASAARQASAADHKEMLVREMSHRAGNMLQFVSSIASQTFRDDVDQNQARRAFSERLSSLSRANYLIAKGGWTQTRLMALTEEVLRPFADRIVLNGRDVLLSPDLSFDLGLILQELAMNSARYGAFAHPDGKVHLDWSIDEADQPGGRALTLHWRDADRPGGEAALPSPRRKAGFGSKLISALIERKWQGRISVDTEPSYHFSFTVPLR